MKRTVLLSFLLTFFAFVAFAQDTETAESNEPKPQIKFDAEEFDFGDIKQGDIVTHVFKFTNNGEYPLVLQNVRTTCGCTVPEWPREPIAPGETSEIKATFNSAGKMGAQRKVITIISNAVNSRTTVTLTGTILPPDTGEADGE